MYLITNVATNFHGKYECGANNDTDNNNINNYDDIIGTNNDDARRRHHYILQENTSDAKNHDSSHQVLDNDKNALIYRFKFTEEFMQELYTFSKIHQYDDRTDFKEAWIVWMNDQNELISSEQERMISLGYHGDILEKMYKSARYYFRKKTVEHKRTCQKAKIFVCIKRIVRFHG